MFLIIKCSLELWNYIEFFEAIAGNQKRLKQAKKPFFDQDSFPLCIA